MAARTWLITGASSGFGLALTKAALARGDAVLACARQPASAGELERIDSEGLRTLALDLTDPGRIEAAVGEAISIGGRIDVLVNNAGRGLFGAAEEVGEAELRSLMDLHFFGPVRLTQALLPHLRQAGGGAIVQVSSQAGRFSGPGLGAYSATKFALEGWSEALAAEVRGFGIRVLLVQPGPFRTGFYSPGAMTVAAAIPAYDDLLRDPRSRLLGDQLKPAGDAEAGAGAILAVLDAPDPPLRLALGNEAVDRIATTLREAADELRRWEQASRGADG